MAQRTIRNRLFIPTRAAWFGAILVVAVGCHAEPADEPTPNPSRVRVFVTIAPQAFFVEQIGGEFVDARVLVAPGQSYHIFEPTPRQVAELAKAQVYFTIGAPFERVLVEKIRSAGHRLEIVDTGEGISRRTMAPGLHDPGHDHGAGPAGDDHAHAGESDPHIWLDPRLVKAQARPITEALKRCDPDHAGIFEARLYAFRRALNETHRRISEKLAPYRGRAFFVYHPAYGYFADAYGLEQVAVETEGKEPGGKRIADLIARAKASGVRTIFIDPQFAPTSAQAIAAAIGGRVEPLDPLAPDYLVNLERMADRIAASFRTDASIPAPGETELRQPATQQ